MLVKVNVTKLGTKTGIGYRVIDTKWISKLQARETTKSKFYYPFNPRDRRAAPVYVETDTSVADLKTAFSGTFQTPYGDLPLYPDDNTAISTVTTTYSWDNFVFAELKSGEASWVYFSEGGWVKKYLVNYDLDDIVDLADFGAIAPLFTTAPAADNVQATSMDITGQLNQNGTVYVVWLADGAAAPTSAEVKAGTASGGGAAVAAANSTDTGSGFTVSSGATLTTATAYDVYVVAEDADTTPDLQASPTLVEQTTS